MAAFIAGEIWPERTVCRFWFGSKNRAIGLPSLSVTVLACGSGPSTRSVDTLFTPSLTAITPRPIPPTTGNTAPAATTPAARQNAASSAIGRRGRRGRLTDLLAELGGQLRGGADTELGTDAGPVELRRSQM